MLVRLEAQKPERADFRWHAGLEYQMYDAIALRGGGLVALGEDTLDFRMKSSRVKADQVAATGAAVLTTACENCHTQLSNLNDHYKMGVKVEFLSSIVADALLR